VLVKHIACQDPCPPGEHAPIRHDAVHVSGMSGRLCEHAPVDASDRDEWTVVLGPGAVNEVRRQLADWRDNHSDVADEDLRLDLIRTDDGDELRVSVRGHRG
jgi:hypothetical protein